MGHCKGRDRKSTLRGTTYCFMSDCCVTICGPMKW